MCEFRFADLRRSGNLSLVVSIDGGGTGGCNSTSIFDKTATGFEDYEPSGVFSADDGIQDINRDGNFELVLWIPLLGSSERQSHVGCDAEWPMIFAWTGRNYTEVSKQYRRYYERHLKSLKTEIDAISRAIAEQPKPLPVQTPQTVQLPGLWVEGYGHGGGHGFIAEPDASSLPDAVPSAAATSAPTPDTGDYDCDRFEAAKTEEFLGIHSDSTMSDAVKDSESNDPDKRAVAALVFSTMSTSEAKADLKELAADSDSSVAEIARDHTSDGVDPGEDSGETSMEPIEWLPMIVQTKHLNQPQ